MLGLTRKADYALVALAHMGRPEVRGETISASHMADEHHAPLPLLMNILKDLVHAGIVSSTRGPQGGYVLAAPPDELSVAAVINALEGPFQLTQCCTGEVPVRDQCQVHGNCPIREPIRRLHARIRGFLDDVTLADLMDSKVDVPVVRLGV